MLNFWDGRGPGVEGGDFSEPHKIFNHSPYAVRFPIKVPAMLYKLRGIYPVLTRPPGYAIRSISISSEGYPPMKTADEWASWIIDYMQAHPVKDFEQAKNQIKYFTKLIQEDAVSGSPANDNPLVLPNG